MGTARVVALVAADRLAHISARCTCMHDSKL
jgi:hypothetical protein